MSKWLEEETEPGLRIMYKIDKVLGSTTSKFQTVDLVDLVPFGRSLVIDGLMQSTRCDEFVYHECLVHPAMLMHPNPKTVYIGETLETGQFAIVETMKDVFGEPFLKGTFKKK